MSHYPLYRVSDEHCDEPDGAPDDEKTDKFREGWDCLTRNASQLLLDTLKPRLVLSGHTHHGKHEIYSIIFMKTDGHYIVNLSLIHI